MFLPGQKVICTNGEFHPKLLQIYDSTPKTGGRYTVLDVVPGIETNGSATVAVLLEECRNKPNRHGIEPGFHLMRFRETTKADDFVAELAEFQQKRRKCQRNHSNFNCTDLVFQRQVNSNICGEVVAGEKTC